MTHALFLLAVVAQPPAPAPAPAPPQPARPIAPVFRQALPPPMPALDVDNGLEAQFAPQFRVLYKAELRFLKATAEPTPEQYQSLAADADAVVKAAAREFGRVNQNGVTADSDPRQALVYAALTSARKHLTPEQMAKYKKESDLRVAARKRAIVANLVLLVDNALVLTADQRGKLADVLAENWIVAWNQPMYFTSGGRYFPPMPDAKIRLLLSDAQRAVWDTIPRGNVRFGVNLQVPNWAEMGDDDEPAAPKPAGGKK